MQFFKNIIISFLAVFFVTSCSEDTIDLEGLGSVTGRVVENGSNEPIENVKISTNPSSSTVFTDEDGFYKIENIPSGEYSLSAQKDGLLAEFEAISIIPDRELEVVFEMDVETASNRPPNAAELILPADNTTGLPIEVELKWSGSDPDTNDELTYTVSLRNDLNSEVELFENLTDTTLVLSDLSFGVKYFWQVATSDGINNPVNSTSFSFETQNPPNNRVIFTRLINGNSVIFSSDEDGGTILQLSSSSKNSFRPRRNESTERIAFLQSVGSQTHLFTMDEDGSNVRQVTNQIPVSGFNLEEIDFSWDGNGSKILFPNQDKLYRINTDGSGIELVYQTVDGSLVSEAVKNSQSGIIALKTNNLEGYDVRIFTINESGVEQTVILEGVNGAAGGLDLSVDNTKLLYTRDVSGFESADYRRLDSRMFVYDFANSSVVDLSEDKPSGTNDLDPRFSPNDVSVIYVNTSNDGVSQKNIQTLAIEDLSSRERLVADAAMPDWE